MFQGCGACRFWHLSCGNTNSIRPIAISESSNASCHSLGCSVDYGGTFENGPTKLSGRISGVSGMALRQEPYGGQRRQFFAQHRLGGLSGTVKQTSLRRLFAMQCAAVKIRLELQTTTLNKGPANTDGAGAQNLKVCSSHSDLFNSGNDLLAPAGQQGDRKSTRLNSSHLGISYA